MKTKYSMLNAGVSVIMYMFIGVIGFYKISVTVEHYGSEMNGLQMFFNQFLKYLTLFETGLSSSIIYYLYEPFTKNNIKQINKYYSAIKQLYKYFTLAIFVIGIASIPIMFFFIGKTNISNTEIIQIYILTFLNLIIVFPFSPYYCLLQADQKMYLSKGIISIGKILGGILSIILIILGFKITLALSIELIINIIFHVYLKFVTLRHYSYLNKYESKDFSCLKKVPYIIPHVIAGVLVNQTDSVLLTKFCNLFLVSVYSSYMYIIIFLRTIINSISRSTQASFGNLFYENNQKMYSSFLIYAQVIFFIVVLSTSVLFISINNFVKIWLGDNYTQSLFVIVLFALYYFHTVSKDIIHVIRDSTGQFKAGVWVTIAEGITNLIISLILVREFGLSGVLLGTIISYYFIDLPINAYIVYKKIFKRNFIHYIVHYGYNLINCILLCIIDKFIVDKFVFYRSSSYILWVSETIIIIFTNFILLFIAMYLLSYNFRRMISIVIKNIKFKTNLTA
jgi:O-antigen/teichoic acid export membrane protein